MDVRSLLKVHAAGANRRASLWPPGSSTDNLHTAQRIFLCFFWGGCWAFLEAVGFGPSTFDVGSGNGDPAGRTNMSTFDMVDVGECVGNRKVSEVDRIYMCLGFNGCWI